MLKNIYLVFAVECVLTVLFESFSFFIINRPTFCYVLQSPCSSLAKALLVMRAASSVLWRMCCMFACFFYKCAAEYMLLRIIMDDIQFFSVVFLRRISINFFSTPDVIR